jgi:hypothetical protein
MHNGQTDDAKHAAGAPGTFALEPARVALAAVDWRRETALTSRRTDYEHGFHPFLTDVLAVADEEKCDVAVCSLWSHSVTSMGALTEPLLFARARTVQTLFLEVADYEGVFRIEVWRKGHVAPHQFTQCLSVSSARASRKRAFMDELPSRMFGSTLFLTCGEVNIISTRRNSTQLSDPYGFMSRLQHAATRVILNPTHDYMRRPEMKAKRASLSQGGRTVLSVWNRGRKPPEADPPWQAFFDGEEVSDKIREVDLPSARDVRVGVIDVPPDTATAPTRCT